MTTTLTPPPADTAASFTGERCDRCGANAKVRATLAGGSDLVFCGHHAHQYATELEKIAVAIVRAQE
jgi:hypothetical protein